jgi:hypothetical protein
VTTELDSVAANAPDNAEAATLRTARKAINAAHGSGNITDEQHAEAIRKLLMNGTALAASPASQAERQRGAYAWLRRVLVGFGVLFLTFAIIVMVSLGVHFLPTTRADISVEVRRSKKIWPEITRPGRCIRAVKAA